MTTVTKSSFPDMLDHRKLKVGDTLHLTAFDRNIPGVWEQSSSESTTVKSIDSKGIHVEVEHYDENWDATANHLGFIEDSMDYKLVLHLPTTASKRSVKRENLVGRVKDCVDWSKLTNSEIEAVLKIAAKGLDD